MMLGSIGRGFTAAAVLAASHTDAQHQDTKCTPDTFKDALPKEATVLSAVAVPAGGTYGEGAANLGYPTNPTDLPALCAVTVNVTSSPISSFRFGVFLPADDDDSKWQGRMLTVGNGGFAGGINWLEMGVAARAYAGLAVVSTDTGHNSTGPDTAWALRSEERRKDFGFRAVHGAVSLGKEVARAYYGRPVARSYYSGASTGGRQGLKEAQLHAGSFDGVLVGAPAWWTAHMQPWSTKVASYNLPATAAHHVPPAMFGVVGAEVVRQCDGVDGVRDGIVSAPEDCHFDLGALGCGAGVAAAAENASACLSPEQIDTLEKIYSDYVVDGELAFPGMQLSSESQFGFMLSGPTPTPFGDGYIRDFLLDDPDWVWTQYNDSLIALADNRDPGDCTADDFGALKAFAERGGKMVLYHGLSDALIPPGSASVLRDRIREGVAEAGGPGLESWFRFFRVPGMQHVQGTAVGAPWYFGGSGQMAGLVVADGGGEAAVAKGLGDLGLRDEEHDLLLGMMRWVEEGIAVDELVATSWVDERDIGSGVLRQRVLCAEPRRQVFAGGDEDEVENWRCE